MSGDGWERVPGTGNSSQACAPCLALTLRGQEHENEDDRTWRGVLASRPTNAMEIGGEQFCEKSAAKQVNIVRVVRWFHLGWTEFAQARVGLMIGDQLATLFIFSSFLAGTRRPQGCVTGQDCNKMA